jgi:dTDP-4-dehydrorhamnose 3,5-epimerase
MDFIRTAIPDVFIVKPTVFGDDRGYFFESFQQEQFNNFVGKPIHFVQDNESKSSAGVLRGLHFQAPPHAQGKLVRVVQGRVLDVAVDIRKSSATYGKHVAVELSADNKLQLYVPEGFAHGFATLENDTIFQYKCTNYYHPQSEQSILWKDSSLSIQWGIESPILSQKDINGIAFNTFNSPFE